MMHTCIICKQRVFVVKNINEIDYQTGIHYLRCGICCFCTADIEKRNAVYNQLTRYFNVWPEKLLLLKQIHSEEVKLA